MSSKGKDRLLQKLFLDPHNESYVGTIHNAKPDIKKEIVDNLAVRSLAASQIIIGGVVKHQAKQC